MEQAGRRVADLDAVLALSAHLCASGPLPESVPETLRVSGAAMQADAVQLDMAPPALSALWQRPGTEENAADTGREDAPALSVPLSLSGDAQGTLRLARAPGSAPFSADDRRLATVAANLLCLRLR